VTGNIEKVLSAANELDKMADELKTMATEMRVTPERIDIAYALAYNWRTEFSKRVVHKLGFGMPRIRKS